VARSHRKTKSTVLKDAEVSNEHALTALTDQSTLRITKSRVEKVWKGVADSKG